MSPKALKIFLLLGSVLLIYFINDLIADKKRILQAESKRLGTMDKLRTILASEKDMPFLMENPTEVAVRVFDEFESALKQHNITVVQKQMMEAAPQERGFLQTQSFFYELRCPDLPSLHKFIYAIHTQSPYLYQIDRIQIENLAQRQKSDSEAPVKAAPEYQVQLALTVYLLRSCK
jgi:hypothetical protein